MAIVPATRPARSRRPISAQRPVRARRAERGSLLPRTTARLVQTLAVLVLGAFTIAPVYWMVITALRQDANLFTVPPKVLPVGLDPGVVVRAVIETSILPWLANSAIVSISATLAAIAVGVPAGYVLSRFGTGGTRLFGGTILVTQMLPPLLLLVPLFIVFQWVALIDTLPGLILADTAMVLPLTIWMSKAMIDSVPMELDQAAMIDGCSRARALLTVVAPICRPGLASVAIYAFIVTWDEFLFARTLLTSTSNWPASVGLYTFQGQYVTPINQVMFAALLFTVPPLLLFLLARKSLISGMTAGALKG